MTTAALSATPHTAGTPAPRLDHPDGTPASHAQNPVTPGGTVPGVDTRKARRKASKRTVAHQAAFLASMVRSFTRRLREQGTDGEQSAAAIDALIRLQAASLAALAEAGVDLTAVLADYAKGEDPGVGLVALMNLQDAATAAVKDVGRQVYRDYGPSAMADDLTISGRPTTRQLMHKRFGPKTGE